MRGVRSHILVSLLVALSGIACNEGLTVETDLAPGADVPPPQCEAEELCCDAEGRFLPEGEPCLLDEESRCSTEDCGGALVTRRIYGRCKGDHEVCAGFPEAGPWVSTEICGWDEVCDPGGPSCVPGACDLDTCGNVEADEHDLAETNETPADSTTVLDMNPPVDPCTQLLFWEGTLHDFQDWDWYRFNTDNQEEYDCMTLDPVFTFTGIPRAWIQFRCWGEDEVAQFDSAEGVFDCDTADPITVDGVPLGQALSCRVSAAASFTHLRCWRESYEDYYNTAMMILVGVGDDAEHPCADYTVTVAL